LVGPVLHAVCAYGFSGALGFKVFRHSGRTWGCKQQHVLPPVLRRHCRVSPQRRVIGFLCLTWLGSAYARGRHPNRNRGRPRIRLSRRHPRVGLDKFRQRDASKLAGRSPRNRIAQRLSLAGRFRPRPGTVCLPHLTARRRSSGQRRTSSPDWQASFGDACSGSESPFARRRRTGALRGFLLRVPDGLSAASGKQRERRPVAEVTRRLPHAWCLTEVSPERKTRSGNTMTPPMGFDSFRREKTR
jgi:hypothetical protein